MSDQQYFVKVRGRTLGPLDTPRVRQLIQQGQVSRTNQVSLDGRDWKSASEFGELFQSKTYDNASHSTGAGHEPANGSATSNLGGNASASRGEPAVWFYSQGEIHQGPVSETTLREMIRGGRVHADNLVWREGMGDWQRADTIRELSGLFQHSAPNQQSAIGENIVVADRNALNSTKAILARGSGWAMAVCVIGYVCSAITLIGVILIIAFFLKADSAKGVLWALISSGYGIGLLAVSLTLNRYLIAVNQFRITDDVSQLNLGLRYLGRIWILITVFYAIQILAALAFAVLMILTPETVFRILP